MNAQGSRSDDRDSIEELRFEIERRDRQIALLRANADVELSARSDFFTSASHDVKLRVHAMKLMARACRDEAALAAQNTSTLTQLARLLDDLERCLGHVLEFARLEGAGLEPQRSIFRLQDLFQGIDLQYEHVANERSVSLRVLATRQQLFSDRTMLLRILENLVSNAIKYTRAKVLLSARQRGDAVLIEIRDQGPGIHEDDIERIFTPFYQARQGLAGVPEGVGLGLAIVKRLCGALGYRIETWTEPAGTLMRVVIPAADIRP